MQRENKDPHRRRERCQIFDQGEAVALAARPATMKLPLRWSSVASPSSTIGWSSATTTEG
jgi:hypothetical protein